MEKEKKKMGRPSIKNRTKRLEIRISEIELKMINELSEKKKISKADVIIESVKEKYQKIKK